MCTCAKPHHPTLPTCPTALGWEGAPHKISLDAHAPDAGGRAVSAPKLARDSALGGFERGATIRNPSLCYHCPNCPSRGVSLPPSLSGHKDGRVLSAGIVRKRVVILCQIRQRMCK